MVAFSLFGVSIYRYGIFYVIAAAVGYCFFWYVGYRKVFIRTAPSIHTILTKQRDDLIIFILLGVLFGARLGHVLIYDFGYYISHPLHILAINEGGMSFIGGIIGVTSALFFFCKKNHLTSKDIRLLLDIVTVIIPIGSLVGRIGNYLNQELYGRPVIEVFPTLSLDQVTQYTNRGIFHVYDNVDTLLRVNTNLLASFFEGFVVLLFMQVIFWSKYRCGLSKEKLQSIQKVPSTKDGTQDVVSLQNIYWIISPLWLFLYSFVRFRLEYVRADSAMEYIGPCTKSQWFFILFMIVSVGLLWRRKKKYIY